MPLVRRLAAAAVVARANTTPFERPDRLYRALAAMRPWGPGAAGAAAAAAARYPNATAVVDDAGTLTYRDLWRRSGALAGGLVDAGAAPGAVIGILARNHRGFVEALVAATMTGADVVLLNTAFAGPQLADVAAAERVGLLLHDADLADVAAACGDVPRLGDGAIERLAARRARPPRPRPPGRLVILTSGTTGTPKGAARRTGSGAIEGVAGIVGRMPLRLRDTQVVAAPLFHGWGLTHLLLGLGRAATTVLARRFDPAITLEHVARHRAEVLVVVPVMLQRILALPRPALVAADTSRLRVIAASGSALGARLGTEVLDRFGPVLYNLYGSTEVAVATVATPRDLRRAPGTAGRPVPGARVEILDAHGNRLPAGAVGRVFVGNAMRFEGYTTGGGKEQRRGLLSSGDLGHIDEHGLLFVDGREDDMIVSGGENVFPSEVEELLAHHPAVAEVAVVGVDDDEFGQALAAYVVRRPGTSLDADGVRDHVRGHLARYKVPRRVEFLDALPRTSTGKVLKRVLVATP